MNRLLIILAAVLAISTSERSEALPDVPTIHEAGVPGFEMHSSLGVLAPAGTAREIIAKLNGEVVRILALPDVNERISGFGAEIGASSPEEFDKFNRAQIAKWAAVVKFSGARAD